MGNLSTGLRKTDLAGLRKLARSLAVSEEVAVAIYERELVRLREGARIEQYVSLFAERNARKILQEGAPALAAAAVVMSSLTECRASAPEKHRDSVAA
jgi:hypothetical protein